MRFFYEEHIGDELMDLSYETAKHVSQVLRMQVGDQFILTDGKGKKAIAEISILGKRACSVRVLKQEIVKHTNPDIHLAISFTKNSARMEWLLEKITEIGVRSIYPLLTSRTEKKEIKTARFQKKLISAMLQSRQYYLPTLQPPIPLTDLSSISFDQKFIAHCDESIERIDLGSDQIKVGNSQLICIGPEGDFSLKEIEYALQQNFKSVTLGNNRLRTETAGLVAVTLLHHYAK